MQILDAVEGGQVNAAGAYNLIRDADPTLIYFIFAWLRHRYRSGQPAAEAVSGRLAEIATAYPAVPRMVKTGGQDSIVAWFEDAYAYGDFDAPSFIELIVEKLEG